MNIHNDSATSLLRDVTSLDSNLNQAVINKISNFHKIAPNFTYSQKS